MGQIIVLLILFICLGMPLLLTVFNIINLFKKKKIAENFMDILTFVLGILLTFSLYKGLDFKDYTETLYLGGLETDVHAPIATWSLPTILTIVIVGLISYCLIRVRKLDLPPLVIVSAMSGILLCSIFIVLYIIQMLKNIDGLEFRYLILFPINYILCSIRAVIEVMDNYKQKELVLKDYNDKFLNKCNQMLNNISAWPVLAIIFVIPLSLILICILVLFGQRPDEAIRAFLETSDWTLSQKVSPIICFLKVLTEE